MTAIDTYVIIGFVGLLILLHRFAGCAGGHRWDDRVQTRPIDEESDKR